jgi:hypothetical protein
MQRTTETKLGTAPSTHRHHHRRRAPPSLEITKINVKNAILNKTIWSQRVTRSELDAFTVKDRARDLKRLVKAN